MIQASAGFSLAVLDGGYEASADNSGMHVRRRGRNWPDTVLRHPTWLRAALQLDELSTRGHAEPRPGGWLLPHNRIDAALRDGFTLPLLWSGWSAYRLRLWAGVDAQRRVRVRTAVLAGGRAEAVERSGRYLRRLGTGQTFLLDASTAALLDVVGEVAKRPPATGAERGRLLGWLRESGEEIGADLGGCLAPSPPSSRPAAPPTSDLDEQGEEWNFASEGLSYSDFLRLPPHLLEAAVAALYQFRGYRVALLPPGNGFGVSVLARNGRTCEIAFVDLSETGPALDAILAAESSVRAALGRTGLRSAVYCRSEISRTVRDGLVRRGVEVHAGRLFAERLRSRGVNPTAAQTWQAYRCRSFAQAIRSVEVTC